MSIARPVVVLLVTIIAAVSAARTAAGGADLAGHWEGTITIPSMELDVDLDFTRTDAGLVGDISIPRQNAVDLPLADIALAADNTVTFRIREVPGNPTFEGTFSDDGNTITGTLNQGGGAFPFTITRTEDPTAAARDALADLDARIEQALTDFMVPGLGVGVTYKGEVIYARGFGHRNIEEQTPVTTQTLFAIGSSTKAFTTFAFGTMVDEGTLDWNEPTRTYMPEFQLYDEFASAHVTPLDMVTHRTGLPRHDLVWYNNLTTPREEFVHRLRYLEPNKELREAWQYNNLMFLAAGYLLGEVHGSTWEDAIRERVFTPLGMNDANFSVAESQQTYDFALPYQEREDALELMSFRDISTVGPAGSINAHVDDMLEWAAVHVNEGRVGDTQVISPATLKPMHTTQMTMGAFPSKDELVSVGYGMGWMIDVYRGQYRVHHGGNIDGFSAMVSLVPRERLGIVVFANKNGTGLPELVVRAVTDRVLGLGTETDWFAEAAQERQQNKTAQEEADKTKTEARVAGTTPPHALDAYAGRYHHPGYGGLTITHDNDEGTLGLEFNGITAPLEHWHYNVFNGGENPDDRTFEDMKIQFASELGGDIATVAARFEPFVDPIVFTRMPDARLTDPAYLDRFVGRYQLAGQTVQITRRATTLLIQAPGQAATELVARPNDRFAVREMDMITFKMTLDANDRPIVRAMLPNGVFELKQVTDEKSDEATGG